ncbi:DUF4870 domain-containing protein [Moorena producens]|uniref:DUF4870 domain-containing protein n=1 Tax=Moorena producens TaxID=1155739 RepID=UPI003C73D7C6
MVYDQKNNINYDPDKRKLLSALCHGAIFISASFVSVLIPLAILLISDDQVVKDNAKESLNFHLNVWLYEVIFGVLTIILIGWPFLGLLVILSLVLPIMAILKILGDPNVSYRYPFIFRVL